MKGQWRAFLLILAFQQYASQAASPKVNSTPIIKGGNVNCSDSNPCNNNGDCVASVKNPSVQYCRCGEDWEGNHCQIKKGKPEGIMKPYIMYLLAIAGGLLLIVFVAAGCRCYKRKTDKRRKRRMSKSTPKFEEKEPSTENIYRNRAFTFEKELHRPISRTESIDSDCKSKTSMSSDRVFHINLNKKKSNSDHVIIEVDNDEAYDSGVPMSESMSTKENSDSTDASEIFNDQITVTDESTSSESPLPRRRQSTDEIFDDYRKRKMHLERRYSSDFDSVTGDSNPYLYFTTPHRPPNRHHKAPMKQPVKQAPQHQHKQHQPRHNRTPRSRLPSIDVEDRTFRLRQEEFRRKRSRSLGDLTEIGLERRKPHQQQRYRNKRLNTDYYEAKHFVPRPGYPVGSRVPRGRGIWAKSNERW